MLIKNIFYFSQINQNMIADKSLKEIRIEFKQISEHYEGFVSTLQAEVNFHKEANKSLRNEIISLIEANKELQKTKESVQDINLDNYKKLTNSVVDNLKQQIFQILEEKQTLHTIWKLCEKTIENLEIEIKNYRKQPNSILQFNNTSSMKRLDSQIQIFKNELDKQKHTNLTLIEINKISEHKLKLLEKKYQEVLLEQSKSIEHINKTESTLKNTKLQIVNIMRDRNDLEKRLKLSKTTLKDHMNRETESLEKIQEILQIADAAIAEKNSALLREKEIREECDHLATTIGEVMKDAANKVEKDMFDTKTKYLAKIQRLENTLSKMKSTCNELSTKTLVAENRSNELENKLKTIMEVNVSLDAELQKASKTIIDMEIKLKTLERLVDQEKKAKTISENWTQELQEFLKNNAKLKEKWKLAVDEITSKLNAQIQDLQTENNELYKRNQHLNEKFKKIDAIENVKVFSS